MCNGVEWSKDKTQAAESIKWRPQQAYGSNQFLLAQSQTVFSTPPKSDCSCFKSSDTVAYTGLVVKIV